MDQNIGLIIDRMVHELCMVEIRRELLEQCRIARHCRIWIETMMFTRNWTILLQRHTIYRVILSADLNPVHRTCYHRLLFLAKMSFSFQILSFGGKSLSKSYPYTLIPMLLL